MLHHGLNTNMIKYVEEDTAVTFAEIKDQICLSLNLSRCPHKCIGCHSPYLQTDCGVELNEQIIERLLNKNRGITCVLFMGGDSDKERLIELADYVTLNNILVGWYSGEDHLDLENYKLHFDYIKVGPYINEYGPLNVSSTNQRMYKIINREFVEDITSQFWRIK